MGVITMVHMVLPRSTRQENNPKQLILISSRAQFLPGSPLAKLIEKNLSASIRILGPSGPSSRSELLVNHGELLVKPNQNGWM